MTLFLGICIISLAALNAYASLRCNKGALSSRGQRAAQIAFIWLVPLLGAALALRLLRNEPENNTGRIQRRCPGSEHVTGLGRLNSQGYIGSPDDTFHGGDNSSPD